MLPCFGPNRGAALVPIQRHCEQGGQAGRALEQGGMRQADATDGAGESLADKSYGTAYYIFLNCAAGDQRSCEYRKRWSIGHEVQLKRETTNH